MRATVEKGWSGMLKSLPPGKYLALACDLEIDDTAEPIRKLWRAHSKAKGVGIGANGMTQINLEVERID